MSFVLLYADDSTTMQRVVQICLAREATQVVAVTSGRDAVLQARDQAPDLAVIDISLPEMDGYATCQAIKDDPLTAHVPVLLMASTQVPLDAARAHDCGADGHIVKPFEVQAFVDKVRQMVAQPAVAAEDTVPPDTRAPKFASAHQAAGLGQEVTQVFSLPRRYAASAPALVPPASGAMPSSSLSAPYGAPRPSGVSSEPAAPAPPPGVSAPGAREPAHAVASSAARPTVEWAPPRHVVTTMPPPSRGDAHATVGRADPQPSVGRPAGVTSDGAPTTAAAKTSSADRPPPARRVSADGLSTDQILAMANDILTQVAWEVVPQMAQAIVKEHVERLAKR